VAQDQITLIIKRYQKKAIKTVDFPFPNINIKIKFISCRDVTPEDIGDIYVSNSNWMKLAVDKQKTI